MGRLLRRRHERGAVAVEAAIIVPFLLVPLVLGTIEVTLLLRDQLGVTSLSRAGARVASSESRLDSFVVDTVDALARSGGTLPPDLLEEIWIYEANSQGFPGGLDSFSACESVTNCVRYGWEDDTDGPGPDVAGIKYLGGSWPATSINACLADPAADSVGVYIRARHDWVVGFFPGSGAAVDSSTVMKFEPVQFPPRPGETNPNLLQCKGLLP